MTIEKISETKNFIDFIHSSGLKICLEKPILKRAVEEFITWLKIKDLDSFSSNLFSLIARADTDNMLRFLKGFPAETVAYLLWYYSKISDLDCLKDIYFSDLGFWDNDGNYQSDIQAVEKGKE